MEISTVQLLTMLKYDKNTFVIDVIELFADDYAF